MTVKGRGSTKSEMGRARSIKQEKVLPILIRTLMIYLEDGEQETEASQQSARAAT
jgi:hypothetical protein